MFGQQDDQPAPAADDAVHDESVNEAPGNDEPGAGQTSDPPAADEPAEKATIVEPAPSAETPDQAAESSPTIAPDEPTLQHSGSPLSDEGEHDQINDIISPAGGYPKRTSYQYVTAGADPSGNSSPPDDDDAATHELIDIKQHALGELAPLIDQLDLPPEEKFHAIMMVIQATDDKSLVKAAYAAAHSIEDEKIRGQALLSIVNEINYFTHQPETGQ
jgi:hypothetical protein